MKKFVITFVFEVSTSIFEFLFVEMTLEMINNLIK